MDQLTLIIQIVGIIFLVAIIKEVYLLKKKQRTEHKKYLDEMKRRQQQEYFDQLDEPTSWVNGYYFPPQHNKNKGMNNDD